MPTFRNEAIINPEILLWARKSAGFRVEEAAKKAQLKSDKLIACEHGEQRLTIPQLRKLSNVYKRPLAFFYLAKAPESEIDSNINDFRRFHNEFDQDFSPELILEIRKAKYRREAALEMFGELDIEMPIFNFRASLDVNPHELAKKIRELLKITKEKQEKLTDGSQALRFWRESIENQGVLVFQTTSKIHTNEMRGFSIGEFPLPIIVLNRKDSPKARVFTLIHELTHIMLRSTGICEVNIDSERQKKIEVFCNAVAGETLVPRDWLVSTALYKQNTNEFDWTNEAIKILADNFCVSRPVILTRLLNQGRISEKYYRQFINKLSKEFEDSKREEKDKEKKGGPNYYTLKLSEVGKNFATLVINSYHQDKIGLVEVSKYLGVKATHFSRIEQLVFDIPRNIGD